MRQTIRGGSKEQTGKRSEKTLREDSIKIKRHNREKSIALGILLVYEIFFTHFLAVPLHSVPALYQEGAGQGEEVVEHWPNSIHCFSVV